MQLFEITLILLSIAVVFLHVARRLRVPFPSLLALAGGCVVGRRNKRTLQPEIPSTVTMGRKLLTGAPVLEIDT